VSDCILNENIIIIIKATTETSASTFPKQQTQLLLFWCYCSSYFKQPIYTQFTKSTIKMF